MTLTLTPAFLSPLLSPPPRTTTLISFTTPTPTAPPRTSAAGVGAGAWHITKATKGTRPCCPATCPPPLATCPTPWHTRRRCCRRCRYLRVVFRCLGGCSSSSSNNTGGSSSRVRTWACTRSSTWRSSSSRQRTALPLRTSISSWGASARAAADNRLSRRNCMTHAPSSTRWRVARGGSTARTCRGSCRSSTPTRRVATSS
mmetsp:Transcript_19124/g.47398  ORF Transcript_19124/g.47398 Transcript_19124/m.47398 type:complete len:201 (-) Transcript_19124:561-1163(-)